MAQTSRRDPLVLVDTTNLSREDWLAYRRQGIGGSDAAAVLGISPFRTAVDLYYDKLQSEKKRLDAEANRLKAEMDRLKALIVADMGSSCTAVYEDTSGSYTVTFNPSYKESILKDSLLRLKESHPEIYAEYVSISESRRFSVKHAASQAA